MPEDDRCRDRAATVLELFSWSLKNGVVAAPEVMDRWFPCLAQIMMVWEL
jgi:hypothetical protein